MRICLDVSPAVHHRAGIARYTQELAAALTTVDTENEYVAFYNRPSVAQVEPPLDRLPHLATRLYDKPWRLSVLVAYLARRPQDGLLPGVDLFHATDHLQPRLCRVPSVFTLHDLAFRFYPETHTPLNRWFHTLMMPHFLRATDMVIAVSENTKTDVMRLYGLDEEKIRVIYEGVNPRFHPVNLEARSAVRQKYGLPEGYILSVGTIEPRKNLTTLLQAYWTLRGRGSGYRLVIAGKKGWLNEEFYRQLRRLGLEDDVLLLGFVPDEDLPALYSAATLFAFPSLYEGFGLPPLEAMACGTPVVVSDTSSLPEVVGDAGIKIGPRDVRGFARAMEQVLMDEPLQKEMSHSGEQQARGFTWEKAAQETLAVYNRAVRTTEQDA
jgi:glycosyltransferase involved in cell wall biosynthesis